jgi:hypothetical protein
VSTWLVWLLIYAAGAFTGAWLVSLVKGAKGRVA